MSDNLKFNIPKFRKEEIEKKLNRLARRAKKKGLNPLSWEWGKEFQTEHKKLVGKCPAYPDGQKKFFVEWQELSVNCTLISYKGWQFLARIEHMPESDNGHSKSGFVNILYVVPGEEVPAKYNEAGPDCDHCRQKRVRRDTFVVKNEKTGAIKQVGSTCMSDFLGHDASGFLAAAEILFDVTGICGGIEIDEGYDEPGFRGYGRDGVDIETVLRCAAASIVDRGGYLSKIKAEERRTMSTSERVRDFILMRVRSDADRRLRDELIKPESFNDDSEQLADNTLAWLEDIADNELEDLDEYRRNLAVIIRAGYCPAKAIGILSSGVFAYQREMNRIIEHTKAAQSEWQGAKGERIGLTHPMNAECVFVRGYHGNFGPGSIVKLVDNAGNRYTWFASSDFTQLPVAVGDKNVDFVATVKDHINDEYQGGCKVTLINRPNFDPKSIERARKRAKHK